VPQSWPLLGKEVPVPPVGGGFADGFSGYFGSSRPRKAQLGKYGVCVWGSEQEYLVATVPRLVPFEAASPQTRGLSHPAYIRPTKC
jgi:hypothetical protein